MTAADQTSDSGTTPTAGVDEPARDSADQVGEAGSGPEALERRGSGVRGAWRFFHAAFLAVTIVVGCFAALQLAGRVLFSQLPRIEGTINALIGQGIVLEGLEGRWRGLNPGVFAERVSFPAGELVGFDFELDLIESLARNRVVARRMTVVDGRVVFEKTPAGWRAQGWRPDRADLDAESLFLHSDQVWIRGRVVARDQDRTAAMHIESWLINVDGGHRFSIRMQSEPNCNDCALAIEGDITDDGPGAVKVTAESFSLGEGLDDMLGIPAFDAAIAGDWRRSADGGAQARLAMEMPRLQTPGADSSVTTKLAAWTENGGYRGLVDSLSVESGTRTWHTGNIGFRIEAVGGELFTDVWVPPFSAEEVAEVAVAAFGVDGRLGRWLSNLAPRGLVNGLGIRIDREGPAFACHGRGAAVAPFRGVPGADNLTFRAAGTARAVRLDLDSYDFALWMPNFVAAEEIYPGGGGSLTFAFHHGNLAVRADNLWLDHNGTRAVGTIALTRPSQSGEVRVAADLTIDRIAVEAARDYLPLTLSPRLRHWLLESVRAGHLEQSRVLFQGNVAPGAGKGGRHFEMSAGVVDGVLDFHPDWPTASRIDANLVVAGRKMRLAGSATVLGIDGAEIDLKVPPAGGELALRVRSRTDFGALFDFARRTPVHEAMPFLSDTWSGTGPVVVDAEMTLPLGTRDGAPVPEDLRLDLELKGASLDLANLGLRFDALNDSVRFVPPHGLSSKALTGTLFGAPASVAIDFDDSALRFNIDGSASIAEVYEMLDVAGSDIVEGRFDFDAVFEIHHAADHPPQLRVESDLVGVGMGLPAPLGKAPEKAGDATVSMQFLDDYVAVSARYDDTRGWLHFADGRVRAAAVGFGVPVPMADAASGRVVVGGGLDSIDAAAVSALVGESNAAGPGMAWELRRFRIGKVAFDSMELNELILDGHAESGETRLEVEARELRGTLARTNDAPWQVELAELRVPATDTARVPLDPSVIDRLTAADVVLDRVFVGDGDYGAWRFKLRPVPDGVELHDVVADLRGLAIASTAPVLWTKHGVTRFDGEVTAGDLRDVLPLWDFVPSVESESFRATGGLRWPGSPLDFDLATLSGEASLDLSNGRFLDVEQGAGAARIMSLVNFSTIVKRMSFDFTDVFGRGISFDRAIADLAVTDGRARFVEPAKITGTGLRFEIEGTVDFASGILDNQLVVTLPVHASLPWWAAYLAFSNPAAAAGVLFGQQVLKDPIKRLSSVAYRVTGPYDDPVVELVGAPRADTPQQAGGDAPGEAAEQPTSVGDDTGNDPTRQEDPE